MQFQATIVIPLLRQVDTWLERCILSALDQTVPAEVIVVPSERTPATSLRLIEHLSKEAEGLRIGRPENEGFAAALNRGIRDASCHRVGFLLSDDWLHPSALRKCLPYDSDIVSTQLSNYAADGVTALGIERRITSHEFNQLGTLQAQASYLSHLYLFQRDKLLEVGGVDETIGETGADDYDLIWTLLEHGASVSIVEEVLYFKRDHHGERLTLRDREAQVNDLHKIFDKHGVYGALRSRLTEKHARWYGRPIHEVVRGLGGKD
ncbi:MAG: glycosyltransferase family 2 protein [Gammaproteobacteria bacterium]|nr:glycosyltransferase family 2 protein [Gammaproteobacteria bacterium]